MANRNPKFNSGVKESLLSKNEFLRGINCSDLKCPICDGNLTITEFLGAVDLICLNTCHLNDQSRKLFQSIAEEASKKR